MGIRWAAAPWTWSHAEHEHGHPGNLPLGADELQFRESIEDLAEDEVVGEGGGDLKEEVDPGAGGALHVLPGVEVEGVGDPAGYGVEGDGYTGVLGCRPEWVVVFVPVRFRAFGGDYVNHCALEALL